MSNQPDEYDSPWKEAVERYFPSFLAFYFPLAYQGIDWSRGYEFLDKELQQVVRDAELGTRLADKLVKVWRKDGEETWVLIHLEVQGQVDPHFAERMFVYHYRIYDRYRRPVASFALLGDERPGWRPAQFGYNLWGCEIGLRFPAVKLLDFAPRIEQLEEDSNVFAVLTAAHLEAQATRSQPDDRFRSRIRLAKSLYRRGFTRDDILELVRFLDWIMHLPEDLSRSFAVELREFEREVQMPYVSSHERLAKEEGLQYGLEQGLQQGLQRGLEQGLERGLEQGLRLGILAELRASVIEVLAERFQATPARLRAHIEGLCDEEALRLLRKQALNCDSLTSFEDQALARETSE
ncbi:MAG: hypothetical protein K0Q72_156 [Armatimonadetes bacterium]|nr:hypothetical protein [Armatimonadota bacterium]